MTIQWRNKKNVTVNSHIQILGGHRDWGNSLCPGEKLYKMLPEIRKRVVLKEPNEGQS